jgi:hypothetical protein
MKLNKILFVFFIPFLFTACVPSELDNIESFVYSFPGLEDIDPLPELTLTKPIEVKETPGEITVTKESDELVSDVIAAITAKNLTEENLLLIENFSEVAPEISSKEIIEAVTDDWITGILNGSIIPSDNLKKIAAEFKKNPLFLVYFAQLVLPTVDGLVPGGRLFLPSDPGNKLFDNPILRSLATAGPCKETLDKIYLENLEKLETQADAQLVQSKTFYDDLRNQALALYTKKLSDKDKIIGDNVEELNAFLIDFNQAVDKLSYPEEVKRGLKIYILSFAIELRAQIVKWGIAYTASAEVARDKRVDLANKEQISVNAGIKVNLKLALEELTKSYNTEVENCHNQGAGG